VLGLESGITVKVKASAGIRDGLQTIVRYGLRLRLGLGYVFNVEDPGFRIKFRVMIGDSLRARVRIIFRFSIQFISERFM